MISYNLIRKMQCKMMLVAAKLINVLTVPMFCFSLNLNLIDY
jgi:hypothetical protein